MSQVVIDTDKIWSEIRIPLAIIVVIALVIIAGVTLYDKGRADAIVAQTMAAAPVATVIAQPTAIPALTPAGFAAYYTQPLEITSMETGSGPQVDTIDGEHFYLSSWQDYYRLQLHEICSFYVTGTTNPYGTVMLQASQVNVVGYAWENNNPRLWKGHQYYYWDGKYWDENGNEVGYRDATGNIIDGKPPIN
jgi:hypothetical protein